jgi:hypothetical protein
MAEDQVTAAERYITLTIGILTIITILLRIAWTTGRLMQQFGDHLKNSERVHQDIDRDENDDELGNIYG